MINAGDGEVQLQRTPGSREGVEILTVVGQLTVYNFFPLQDLARKDATPVLIIDLQSVPYMDSAALGCLVGIHVSCEKNGRKYALVNVPDRIKTLFSVAGVTGFLVTFGSVAEAEDAFK